MVFRILTIIRSFALSLAIASILILTSSARPAEAQRTPELPDEILRMATELDGLPEVRDEPDVSPPLEPADPGLPSIALRTVRTDVENLMGRQRSRRVAGDLEKASAALGDAWRAYNGGSDDLSHLRDVGHSLASAERALSRAAKGSDTALLPAIHDAQNDIATIATRMAESVMLRAERAGVEAGRMRAPEKQWELGIRSIEGGKFEVGVAHMSNAMWLAGNSLVFDVERFEQNILDALAGNTVGYAFSIAWKGQLYQGGRSAGLARTNADIPLTAQSQAKEMHVASVSKPLTTIAILRLLEDNGLTPDDEVAPYLPSNWTLGDGVEDLRFRDFMKHESGFAQIGAGSAYDALRTAIATDVGATDFLYSNANFGLMRVLSAGLQGFDLAGFPFFLQDDIASILFITHAQNLYASIGVSVDCHSNDPNPTIQYNLPAGLASGYLEPDRRLGCGGYGWFISSNELAAVMSNLRLTENLISNEMRAEMEDNFLGWMDPANYGWINGDFGVYHMHGGDWFHGDGEAHACAITFPIQVQAGLVINSERGATMAYQCNLLEIAFDDAWVSN